MKVEMMFEPLVATLIAASSPFRPVPDEAAARPVTTQEAPVTADETSRPNEAGEGVPDLPYAFGRRFLTLDEYLLHLEQRAAPIDLPWWRRIGPDRYERVKRLPGGAPREVASRADLMKRFGFSE